MQRLVSLVAVVYSLLRITQHYPYLLYLLLLQLDITLYSIAAFFYRTTQTQNLFYLSLFYITNFTLIHSLRKS